MVLTRVLMQASSIFITVVSYKCHASQNRHKQQRLVRDNNKTHKGNAILFSCEGNPLVTGACPSQRAGNTECVSMAGHDDILSWMLVRHQVNSFWPSDVIWRHGFKSTSVQVMACRLRAPSYYLNSSTLRSCGIYHEQIWMQQSVKQDWDLYYHNLIQISQGPMSQRWWMMTSSNGNFFRVTSYLCGEFTDHRWIPRTKASDAEFWCFL